MLTLWLAMIAAIPAWSQDTVPEPSTEGDEDVPEGDEDMDEDGDGEPPSSETRPPRVIQLAPTESIPSALDEIEELLQEADDPASRAFWKAALEVVKEQTGTPIRGAWFVRPRLALGYGIPPEGRFKPGFVGGVVVGHRWWPVRQPKRIEWGGETTFWAEGYVGGLRGAALGASSTAGPWIGPIGISAGVRTDLTRFVVDGVVVPTGLSLGPEAVIAVDGGPLKLWVGGAALWGLTKSRLAPSTGPSLLGSETVWTAGAAIDLGLVQPRLHASVRPTTAGLVGMVGIGFQLTPSQGGSDKDDEEVQ